MTSTEAPRCDIEKPEVDVVAEVRHWVVDHLCRWEVVGGCRDDLLLVVSELVTNSVRHARTAFSISLHRSGGCVLVEVFDRDTRLPVLVGTDGQATSGRGLQIVAAVARDWGSRTEEQDGIQGKVVWAEMCPPDDDEGGT